jgi:hypothetical protein
MTHNREKVKCPQGRLAPSRSCLSPSVGIYLCHHN